MKDIYYISKAIFYAVLSAFFILLMDKISDISDFIKILFQAILES